MGKGLGAQREDRGRGRGEARETGQGGRGVHEMENQHSRKLEGDVSGAGSEEKGHLGRRRGGVGNGARQAKRMGHWVLGVSISWNKHQH